MTNETELLRAFKENRSEEAFAELVGRYAGLVYSAARRRMPDAALAEDITQLVFIRFAKSPPEVRSAGELAAWLHRTTVNVTIDTWRSENRRRNREQQAFAMESATDENRVWEEISPDLDEALNRLEDKDREVLLLRYLNQKTMREVGLAVGVSEDAAKMRVGRALDRLRALLGAKAATCTAATLGTILIARSTEAVPGGLASRLAGIKIPALVAGAGIGGMLGTWLRMPGVKLAASVLVLAVAGIGVVSLARSGRAPTPKEVTPGSKTEIVRKATAVPQPERSNPARIDQSAEPPSRPARILFHVLDAEAGGGIANARIRYAYFGVGGMGESHETVTDDRGDAVIAEPDDPTKTGPNVFVVAEGFVPKAVGFRNTPAPEYTIKLPTARKIGGLVIDEQGLPVADVEIQIQGPGNREGQIENVDFQTCPILNQLDGSWTCSYIPKDYTNEIRLLLKKPGYAMTHVAVPVPKVDLTNLTLVINQGFSVVGRITDQEERPIADAQVSTVVGGQGRDRISATTDESGKFTIFGLDGSSISRQTIPATNSDGRVILRSLAGKDVPQIDLSIQARGYAAQVQSVRLTNAFNAVAFVMSPGKLFHGHVLDAAGHPITNAVVQTDWDNQGLRAIAWGTRTDTNGYFEWRSAPENPLLYWFEAEGYQWQRDVLLVADGSSHEIVLKGKTGP